MPTNLSTEFCYASQDAPGAGDKAPTSAIPQPEAKAVPAAQVVQQEQDNTRLSRNQNGKSESKTADEDFDKLGHMTGLVNAGQFYTAVHRDFGLNPSQVSKMEPVIGLIKAGKFNEAYDEVKIQGAREGTK